MRWDENWIAPKQMILAHRTNAPVESTPDVIELQTCGTTSRSRRRKKKEEERKKKKKSGTQY